jgi:glycosyltransferase involved in cell wall biosynthesis
MNICFIYPNQNNYSETFIYNHKKFLNPSHTLTGGWRGYLDKNGKSIFNFKGSEFIRVFLKRIFPFLYNPFYTYFLSNYLKREKIDIVLAEYGVTGTYVCEACKKSGTPLIVHFHGFDAFEVKTLEKFDYKKMFDYAQSIIAVSTDMFEQLIKLGANRNKVHLIPYGVLTNQFKQTIPSKNSNIVIAVGRFTLKKAPQLSIQAFKLVLEKIPNVKLQMIGKGELFDECNLLIKQLGIEKSIELLGIKTPDEISEYLSKAKIFIQHSMFNPINNDSEGTPNSILEASSTGLPIVSTKHGGIKDAVSHSYSGFLVEEGDYKTMAEYICQLLEDDQLADSMGKNGREKMIADYEMENQIGKLKKLLSQK